jgi:ABC-2 type transport system permease protein
VAVFGFAANGILPQVEGLEWTEQWSSFQWLNGSAPLDNGVNWGDVGLMGGLMVVLVAIGIWAFGRRDVAV